MGGGGGMAMVLQNSSFCGSVFGPYQRYELTCLLWKNGHAVCIGSYVRTVFICFSFEPYPYDTEDVKTALL